MIMPASFSLDNPVIRDELSRHLSESWNAVIERDVDGPKSVPYQKDKEIMRFGNCIAARRVARTILLGSAPSVKQMNVRGIEQSRIRLGVIQPGEQIAVFNDALSTLRIALTYLYSNNEQTRYWYDTRPTLRKTMEDRASQLSPEDVIHEVERRLRTIRRVDPFIGIHCCPSSSLDIPDEQSLRLVILPPTVAYSSKDASCSALETAKRILDTRGDSPRMYKNMLAFVAADSSINEMLFTEIKRFIAWQSIKADSEELNLDATQIRETEQSIKRHNETIELRINETYSWLLLPYIDVELDVRKVQWNCQRINGSRDNCAVRAASKMRQEETVIVKWGPALLTMELQRWFWKNRPFIKIKDLWESLCTYCYLPRLSSYQVLEGAIQAGLATDEYFGVAEVALEDGSYLGLKFNTSSHLVDRSNFILTVDEVKKALQDKKNEETDLGSSEVADNGELFPLPPKPSVVQPKQPTGPRHFYLSTKLDTTRYIRDIGKLNEEVLNHLLGLDGSSVEIRLDVQISFKEDVPNDTVRTVIENCRTLKVEDSGFD
jgi:predicted AAA+ superfamily ATPase